MSTFRCQRPGKRLTDVFPNKANGARLFVATHPYIMMNYTNNLNDVSTLVHEMGHSMHSYYSRKRQPYPTADYCIFTAEVASTTNEVLFLNDLIAETKDRKKRLYLLNRRLENIRTTVYRQTMFASFEREVHKGGRGRETPPSDSGSLVRTKQEVVLVRYLIDFMS